MPWYEIEGKGKESGRKRKRTYSAANERLARQLAEKDGTVVENIIELPPDPPTERQLEYAKSLGITIPTNATMADLSDLISVKVDRDRPSMERHRKFAQLYGIETTKYVGKKVLFDRIQTALAMPGREQELLSWFTYRVYRELTNASESAPIKGPDDPIIQEITAKLLSDEKIIKSVRRYEGRDLIWFGEWTSPDGWIHKGGSNQTMAYKAIALLLKEKVGLSLRHKDSPQPAAKRSRSSQQPGCMVVILGLSSLVMWGLSLM